MVKNRSVEGALNVICSVLKRSGKIVTILDQIVPTRPCAYITTPKKSYLILSFNILTLVEYYTKGKPMVHLCVACKFFLRVSDFHSCTQLVITL